MADFAKGPCSSSPSNGASSSSNSFDKIEVVTHCGEESIGSDGCLKQRRIETVPLILRSDKRNEGCYDPRVVSVGPYHHGKQNLQKAENLKPRLAQRFVSHSHNHMEEFRHKVWEKIDDARSSYVDGSTDKFSDEEFTEMMLLDACLVLAYIEHDQRTLDEIVTCLGMQALSDSGIDIFFLLENQLPFLVLEIVMSLKFQGNEWMDVLDTFCDMLSFGVEEYNNNAKASEICKKQPLHLIEYFWLRERAFNENTLKSRSSTARISAKQSINKFMCSYSVSGLKRMGIYVRPTGIRSRKGVEFTSFFFFGVLKLPPLFFTPGWIVRRSNQVAYELGLNDRDNQPTIAYLNFMKLLINRPDDVKELCSKAILFTTFSSDEEVVEKFNGIITAPEKDFSIYDEVEEKIQMFYYHNKWKSWTAELQHNHFSSPWKFIGFLAATSLLFMTFLQTYFTMYPP